MEVIKIMIIITITVTLSITITMRSFEKSTTTTQTQTIASSTTPIVEKGPATTMSLLSRSVSRFLAQDVKNPRSASHCHKNKKMCEKMHGKGWECCNNKCVNLMNDKHNCGGCKNKCKYTAECCRGQCVDVAYDKRHCGQCNHHCDRGKFCVYGMCEYA
ncbi:stigma-specific STIG1-like protein 1 [Momordica charantia]|uniref:Stigma-specific STIG1-like protein 1 n=1 Tax=Momordica charantia TaxID=3673 RepID=A0A6J1DAS6_MOMCH|nr:stigma-specific STIG1-like protein 1 [Momordica charantia]